MTFPKQCCALLAAMLISVSAVNAGEDIHILQSAVFPGMGQLDAGHKWKGLAYMGTEIVLVSFMFHELSHISAYANETVHLETIYNNDAYASSYSEKKDIFNSWNEAYTNLENAKRNTGILVGGAIAWWAFNIMDAALFTPAKSRQDRTASGVSVSDFDFSCGVTPDNRPRASLSYRIQIPH